MTKFQKIFFLLMVIITAPAIFYLSEKVKPAFVEKQYQVVANYPMPAGKSPKAIRWDRLLESAQDKHQIKEQNVSIEDTLKNPTGSWVTGSFVEDQTLGVKFQYFIEKSMKILSLAMLAFGFVSLFSVLIQKPIQEQNEKSQNLKDLDGVSNPISEPIETKIEDSFEDDPFFEELKCSYCHKEIKKTDLSTTNALSMRYHRKCWDEFSDDE